MVDTNATYWICEFVALAKEKNNIPLNKFKDFAIKTKNAALFFALAEYAPDAPIKELADAVIETKNAEYIYMFARYVSDAPIKELATAICETKDAEYIYMFAKYVPSAPLGILLDGILKVDDIWYVYKMVEHIILNVPNTKINKLHLFKYVINELEKRNIPIARFAKKIHNNMNLYYRYLFIKARIELKIAKQLGINKELIINPNSLELLQNQNIIVINHELEQKTVGNDDSVNKGKQM